MLNHYTMKAFKIIVLTGLLLAFYTSANAQFNLKRQLPEKTKYEAEKVIDSTYGIVMYEPLNLMLNGDSTRLCGNYACQSWVEDIYVTGELLHKGFYIDGQLKTYKNYYPNGNLERDFKALDNYRSSVKLYYPNGNLKSDIKYNEGYPEFWVDYNEGGTVIYQEEMDKTATYYLYKKFFYDNGAPQRIMELSNKKSKEYTYFEYYPDGKIKIEGHKVYSDTFFDYVNHGKWKYYDESGNVTKTEEYNKGEKVN